MKIRILKYTLLSVFLGIIVAGGIVFWQLYSVAQTLPPVEEIAAYRFNEPSMVYDVEGRVIAELGTERRYPIRIDDMPLSIRQAVIATEDARFYEHSGIDMIGIGRAVLANIKAGRFAEGGSTLTQQLTKNIFFTPEKKLIRKYKEAVLAYRIDNYLTKDEILEFYLNFVNFGRGGYGVQAAAVNYFAKDAKDMTLAESALLAGIPKAPGIYAPHINPERALQRRNHVLLRMYENGYITEDVYLATVEEPIVIAPGVPLRLRHAGYFLEYVQRYLSDELGISDPQGKGLRVYTTLNVDFQIHAESAVRNNLRETAKRQGYFGPLGNAANTFSEDTHMETEEQAEVLPPVANLARVPSYLRALGYTKAVVRAVEEQSVSIQLSSGEYGTILLADNRWAKPVGDENRQLDGFSKILRVNDVIYVVQKPDSGGVYLLEQDPPMEGALLAMEPQTGAIFAMVGGFAFEKSMFNRAVQAKRQTGSVFKPLVYAAALETGMQSMTKILDAPILSAPDDSGMVWRPKNFEDRYYGETTLKEGLTRSRNVVTIRMSEQVGIGTILRYAKLFGITSELAPDMSITIGSGSVSLQEMVFAYATFPNMGQRPANAYFVTRVEDSGGNILFDISPPEHVRVLKPQTAQIMTDILVNVVESGTGARARAIPRPIGAKTGTTNERRDTWFIGFLPNFVVGVWVGYDEFRPLGIRETGAQAAATWVEFVRNVAPNIAWAVFPVTEEVVYRRVDTSTWEPTNDLISGDIAFEPFTVENNTDESFSDQ